MAIQLIFSDVWSDFTAVRERSPMVYNITNVAAEKVMAQGSGVGSLQASLAG